MKTSSLSSALIELIAGCQSDQELIKERQASMKARLDNAAALHGIDPSAVRRLLLRAKKNDIDLDRNDEIDAIYRVIVEGGEPALPSRSDGELDRVLALTNTDKPPTIAAIRQAIECSQGKAHKLRTLAAARLLAKSSSSREIGEHELLAEHHEADGARVGELQEEQIQPPECEAPEKKPPAEDVGVSEPAWALECVANDDLEFPAFLNRRALAGMVKP